MSFFALFCRCQPPDKELENKWTSDVEETRQVTDVKLEISLADAAKAQGSSSSETSQKEEDKGSDRSTEATSTESQELPLPADGTLEKKGPEEKPKEQPAPEEAKAPEPEKPKPKPLPEPLSALEDNNFNDRGTSGLDETKTYKYTLENDYQCVLSGWTHTRPYAFGFLRNRSGTAGAVVSGLDPGVPYLWKVYQVASLQGGTNGLTVNGEPREKTTATASHEATASGRTLADASGKITFTFTREDNEVHLSGLAVAREERKEGKKLKAKAKAKVKAKAKGGKNIEYDEVGRRIDKLQAKKKVYEDSSSSDDDIYCPSSKKMNDFERDLKKMKKKIKAGMTPEQREEMENPFLHTQVSEQERELKKQMFRSFYQEQYRKIGKNKSAAALDLKQYEKTDPATGKSVLNNSGLVAEGGHRPMPRPKGVKVPKDFRKEVGRVSTADCIKLYGCSSKRMLVSVYGDLFDVSDRPDKYGENGPYWYMTGKDITWGLVCGEDNEDNTNKFFDLFKIQPAEAADKRLQGLMSWWAFYEKEYGKPVGRHTGYDKEWGLPPPPNTGENCSIM
eukprot:TRINITY_DN24651_c0_g1_i1.p1 TRINITY_DN24651_c0_g1~~TRINITY_DN24651_c0_g1_i1.p1  ORF type:complete len:563 (-),score=132.72 TRINITY_DN24651_c0_g1_i1:314-2002(-)